MKENILLLRENQIVRFKDDSWFSSGTIIRAFPDQYSLTEGNGNGMEFISPLP